MAYLTQAGEDCSVRDYIPIPTRKAKPENIIIFKGHTGMIKRSARRAQKYTVIYNQLIDDKSIKSDALGLIVYVLSKPDNWKIRATELQSRFQCGEYKIRKALTELRKSNYVEMIRHASGNVDWVFHDEPLQTAPNNHTAKTHMWITANSKNPHVDNQHVLVSTERTTNTERALVSTNGDFDIWYQAYPKKKSKKAAIKAWEKAELPDLNILLAILEDQKQNDEQWQDARFIPYPASYLNGEKWTDEIQQAELTEDQKYGLRQQRAAAILSKINGGDVGGDDAALPSPMGEDEWGDRRGSVPKLG